ncbi:MAG: hypothetical protein KGL92_15510 [Gammaproteobacteria bacterium]|nr:hypothetical protein [Gammaproteobacteria bacterium]MDE2349911.1 hypothetical protein [Gammaproteobacteria bacterium]
MFKPRVLALCLVCAAPACHGGSHPSAGAGISGAPKPHAAPAGPTIAAQTVGMVEAPGSHKSTVQVSLKFALARAPVVGTPLSIDLAVIPRISADAATLSVSPSPAFSVAGAERTATWAPVDPTKAYHHQVTVTPATPGVEELDVAVSLRHDGITETRGFSLPVIVGAAQ